MNLEKLAEVFKALSNVHRLRIIVRLASCCRPGEDACSVQGEAYVGELCSCLSVVPSTVSHHVKELCRARLISAEKHGKHTACCVNAETAAQLAEFFTAIAGKGRLPACWSDSA